MPNPKRRHSKQRTSKRRSHDFLTPVSTSRVPQLPRAQAAPPICRKCGQYKGREVLAIKEAS